MLSIEDHSRDSAGLRYVYPVVSRRAGGLSVGINLNVNSACNWACVYCQVEGLKRGGPPPVDLDLLAAELGGFLDPVRLAGFMARAVPEDARRLVDVAFSGNGEPTTAPEFPQAVHRVRDVLAQSGLADTLPVRLITNGSLLHRAAVRDGIRTLGENGGEVWFKLDRALPAEIAAINGVSLNVGRVRRDLAACAQLATTWVQTCWFALDGIAPGPASRAAYSALLAPLAGQLAGVHLYGLARPSLQPGAQRLQRLPDAELEAFGDEVRRATGIRVVVSP